jgi:FkbM family methyltransferase
MLDQIRTNKVYDENFDGFRRLAPSSIGFFMDIGANRGQSIVSLKTIFQKAVVHAFEANLMFFAEFEELRRLLSRTLVVHCHGLGRDREEAKSRDRSVAMPTESG